MKLEICTSLEWWRVNSPLDFDGIADSDGDDAAQDFRDQFIVALEDAGHEVEHSKGERCLLHGWNGANTFERKGCGVGTFDEVSNAEWDAIGVIFNNVVDPWQKEWEEIAMRNAWQELIEQYGLKRLLQTIVATLKE